MIMSKTKQVATKKPQPKVVEIDAKPTLVLGKNLMNLFNYFHNQVGKDEWSGILFYTVNGTIKDIGNMEFTANHMMLKDIGTAASTGYEFDETVLDYFDVIPQAEEMKMGMVHTHHNMSNYFSSVDMDELKDNARNHNYYLSLVASFDCNYTAKLAIHAVSKDSTVVIKGDDGEDIEQVISGEDIVYVANCDIIFELDSFNIKAIEDLKKQAKQRATKKPVSNNIGGHYHQGNLYPVTPNKEGGKKLNKKNPLTDKAELADAITAVLYCNMYDSDLGQITPWIAFKRMDEVLQVDEVDEYIDTVEQHMESVISYRFGGSDLDTEEFADAALKYLENLEMKENATLNGFIEMLKFHSSEYDELVNGEELIAI